MKKNFLVGYILTSVFWIGVNANASVTNSTAYKISVTIPPHVETPSLAVDANLNQNLQTENLPQINDQQIIEEETQRNNLTVTIKTVVLK